MARFVFVVTADNRLSESDSCRTTFGNVVGERGSEPPLDQRLERVQLSNAQRMVAVQVDGAVETSAVHTVIARRLHRAD